MKTLDEVIDYLEGKQACGEWPGIGEALHYLKEYKNLQMGYIKAIADLENNPPLTWEELKDMEGKPVWVELQDEITRTLDKSWCLCIHVGYQLDKPDVKYMDCIASNGAYYTFTTEDYGKTWQVYRKEQNERT